MADPTGVGGEVGQATEGIAFGVPEIRRVGARAGKFDHGIAVIRIGPVHEPIHTEVGEHARGRAFDAEAYPGSLGGPLTSRRCVPGRPT